MELFRPDGRLNDRAWAQQEIASAVKDLLGDAWAKVRRSLANRRSLTFLDRLHRHLELAEPREELREALLRRRWLLRQSSSAPTDAPGSGRWLAAELVQTVRASSAVECMNSVLRMHQGRHRTVTQPMLDLKRLYWNCRPFRSGKRRTRCPYEHLGLPLPTTDWWALLQMDPAELTQQLSSSEVTI